MTEQNQTIPPRAVRDDKLRAIAHVFGDAVAARLRATPPTTAPAATDANRIAWQTNRLIRHLRDRVAIGAEQSVPAEKRATGMPEGPATSHQSPRVDAAVPTQTPQRQGARIPALAPGEDLAGEHPAVIAHVLRNEPQHVRVTVLRALPGHISRAVMRRLRNG